MGEDNTNTFELRLLLHRGQLLPHLLTDAALVAVWGYTWSPALGSVNDWKIMQESLNAEAAYRWVTEQRKKSES